MDVVGWCTGPREPDWPTVELLGQSRVEVTADLLYVGGGNEDVQPRSPAVIGGGRCVEAEHV